MKPGRRDPRHWLPRPGRGAKRALTAFALLWILGGAGYLFVQSMIVSRKPPIEARVLRALRTISSAQRLFREQDEEGDGVDDYAEDLAELGRVGLIDPILASGLKTGYRFQLWRSPSEPRFRWLAVATPAGHKGDRVFLVDQSERLFCRERRMFEVATVVVEVGNSSPTGFFLVGR